MSTFFFQILIHISQRKILSKRDDRNMYEQGLKSTKLIFLLRLDPFINPITIVARPFIIRNIGKYLWAFIGGAKVITVPWIFSRLSLWRDIWPILSLSHLYFYLSHFVPFTIPLIISWISLHTLPLFCLSFISFIHEWE